jgi:oxalate decarboxylase/phosphoglucose isomerase-like protein (cupin superfamily)
MSLETHTESLIVHKDDRGRLIKAWPRQVNGEVYVVEIRPGSSRGNHLHLHGGEWFIPIAGTPVLVVEDPETKQRVITVLDGVRARVEAGQAHAIFATKGPVLVMAVADLPHEQEVTQAYRISPP